MKTSPQSSDGDKQADPHAKKQPHIDAGGRRAAAA